MEINGCLQALGRDQQNVFVYHLPNQFEGFGVNGA